MDKTIYGERFLNDTKGRFEDYSEVDSRYDPQGSIAHIDLPFALLSPGGCVTFQSEPSEEVLAWARVGERYRFLWHPEVERQELVARGMVRTQPTSSTRTLLTERSPRVYVKTDLDKKHFCFIRRLRRSSVEHSIAICNDLRELCRSSADLGRYSFLPESLGVVVQGGSHEGSGVIYRESTPYPHAQDRRVMVPYHSLYAEDPQHSEDRPLVVQIVEANADTGKLDYYVSEVVGPLLEAWVMLVSTRGLLPELHGQNALAEMDADFRVRRVVHRDFQGTYSDAEIRARHGLRLFAKHTAGSESGTTVGSQYSHVFDNMIGKYLISRLSKVFCAYFGADYGEVASAIRDYHRGLPGYEVADFPETVYGFGQSAREQVGNEVQFVDTGKRPEFR